MSEVMLKRCIDHLGNRLTDDPLSLMNWVGPPPDLSRDSMTHRVAVLCDTATFACSEVNRLTREVDALTASLARVTAERDEARASLAGAVETLTEIAEPDTGGFYVELNSERLLVTDFAKVRWRMDAAQKALTPPAPAGDKA